MKFGYNHFINGERDKDMIYRLFHFAGHQKFHVGNFKSMEATKENITSLYGTIIDIENDSENPNFHDVFTARGEILEIEEFEEAKVLEGI